MTCPSNHPATALYAMKMADPQGSAVYGEHFGCEMCDDANAERAAERKLFLQGRL
jgi:hypothetical protein